MKEPTSIIIITTSLNITTLQTSFAYLFNSFHPLQFQPHSSLNMQFFTSAIAIAIIGLTSAVPIDTNSGCPSTGPEPSNIIRPAVTSQYEVSTGAVHYDVTSGKIFKDGKTTDITTLLTFEVPAESAGKICTFHFDLDSSATVSGSAQFDVFTSLAPAEADSSSWPSGNLRDQYVGRMAATVGGSATWVPGFPTFGQSFLCPAGQTFGGELVGTGDADVIEWLAGSTGPYIMY
ncbi:hypothetical protein C7974DRAFT_384364 [Boeremia exigua]|uniref:uncharacterized protein n=1 Tax=Boeremia exigua TaxID=749465 RepID=UPI001E8CF9B0|nr:uncharacterized protein C7974DRAFT_384364 [Boeremia exigua]KAH6644828.1 hypothetical protein C7974DRAFT_384364 [Boeremia exigua]